MILADYHTHSKYSADGREEPETLCLTAINKGLSAIAITDHFECDHDEFESDMFFNVEKRKEEILAIKEKYRGRLDVIYGVELGQPHSRPDIAKDVLKAGEFDFVIGSLHNLRKLPDFHYFDYTKVKGDFLHVLIKRTIEELMEIASFDGIDTLAHITYIHRYVKASGNDVDLSRYYSDFDKLYKILIKNNTGLEINTSTLWKGYGFSMPNEELIKLYYECGGRLITVGSEAHFSENVGGCIEDAYATLKSIGFKTVLAKINGEKTEIKI